MYLIHKIQLFKIFNIVFLIKANIPIAHYEWWIFFMLNSINKQQITSTVNPVNTTTFLVIMWLC